MNIQINCVFKSFVFPLAIAHKMATEGTSHRCYGNYESEEAQFSLKQFYAIFTCRHLSKLESNGSVDLLMNNKSNDATLRK